MILVSLRWFCCKAKTVVTWFDLVSQWRKSPPRVLVAGDGALARALALVTGGAQMTPEDLAAGPDSLDDRDVPRVFEKLDTVFIVLGPQHGAGTALCWVELCWSLVERVSSMEEEHEVRFVFVSTVPGSVAMEESFAVGLAASPADIPQLGYAVWVDPANLRALQDLLNGMKACDLKALRGRRRADSRRQALRGLLREAKEGKGAPATLATLAQKVLIAFERREMDLDLFCYPPTHCHGNQLRHWLSEAVTGEVTPSWQEAGREELPRWLSPC
jgi:hypothetical protein